MLSLVIVQNNKRCTVHVLKYSKIQFLLHIKQTNRLILFRVIISVCCGKGQKRENTFSGKANRHNTCVQSGKKPLLSSSRPSVCWYVTARLPLDGFPWNLVFGTSIKILKKDQICLNSRILHLYRSTFYCCRWHYMPIKPLSSSEIVPGFQDSRGGTNITRTRPSVTLHVNCSSFWTQEENLQQYVYLLYRCCLSVCLSVCPRLDGHWINFH